MLWNPTPDWEGQDAFIIGGGTSLKDFDWNLLKGRNTIGCNDAYLLGEDICKICLFVDDKWFEKHKEGLSKYEGLIVGHTKLPMKWDIPNFRNIKRHKKAGYFKNGLGWGGNSGCSAINLAVNMGASTIYLLGFDMKLSNEGKNNWHVNKVDVPNPDVYSRFLRGMQRLKYGLDNQKPDVQIVNINDDTALEYFPIIGTKEFWDNYEIDSNEEADAQNDFDFSSGDYRD